MSAAYFYRGKKICPFRRLVISIVLFLLVCAAFYAGLQKVSSIADAEQRTSLELAVQRGIAHCYATEGRYPQSLEYLKAEYGIQYDTDKYFVDYQVSSANIMPDVTVIEK